MKIIENKYSVEDVWDQLEITVNDEILLNFGSYDSPEDNHLHRNFSDCYRITELMRLAWEAGKNGEEFILENISKDPEEE